MLAWQIGEGVFVEWRACAQAGLVFNHNPLHADILC